MFQWLQRNSMELSNVQKTSPRRRGFSSAPPCATYSVIHCCSVLLGEAGTIEVEGREIRVVRASENVAWFEFEALCEGPRGAADYIELARDYMMSREQLRRYRRATLRVPSSSAGSIGRPSLASAEKGRVLYERIRSRISDRIFLAPALTG